MWGLGLGVYRVSLREEPAVVEPGGLVLGRAKEGVAYLVGVGIRAEVKGLGLG